MKKKTPPRPRTIFTYGESIFDAKALKELIAAARPELPPAKAMTRPPTLRRITDIQKHESRTNLVVRALRAASVTYDVHAIILHRDLDEIEPADCIRETSKDEEAHKLDMKAVSDSGIKVIATSPAWEMEAWWFMWPDQVAKHRPTWEPLKDRSGKRVDRIKDAKEILTRELRPSGKVRVPDYSETDAPYIAALIRKDGTIRKPKGVSMAFSRFLAALDEIAVSRLGTA